MSKREQLSRREILKRSLLVGAAAAGGAHLLAACGDKKTLTCTDTKGLSEAEIKTRTDLGYVDKSPETGKDCTNCNFYQTGQADGCGGCTLMKGPIHPKGYCKSWVVKA